jgi:hypothetical protein
VTETNVVSQLVPPGVVEQAEGLLIWHGGLVATPGMTFISVTVEHSAGQPAFDREWLRNNNLREIITASIVDQESGREVARLDQGSTGGTTPIMGLRYVQRVLDSGAYVLEIRVALHDDMFSRRYNFHN